MISVRSSSASDFFRKASVAAVPSPSATSNFSSARPVIRASSGWRRSTAWTLSMRA